MGAWLVTERVEFPVTVVGDEWERHEYTDVRSLEIGVEFLDETEGKYVAHDAQGRSLRIVVWELRLLLAQLVPPLFDVNRIAIQEHAAPEGRILSESVDGVVLRTVHIDDAGDALAASPATWDGPVDMVAGSAQPSPVTPPAFSKMWLEARLGHRPI